MDTHTMNQSLQNAICVKYNVPEDARLGWHFCASDKKLRFDDNRIIRVGRSLKVMDTPSLCEYGLHASPTIDDAMDYRIYETDILCLVWVRGEIDARDDDKFCGKERHCLAMLDATAWRAVMLSFRHRENVLNMELKTRCKPARNMWWDDKINVEEYDEMVGPHNIWFDEQMEIIWDDITKDVLQYMGVITNE